MSLGTTWNIVTTKYFLASRIPLSKSDKAGGAAI
jgi:hypothetical protein